MATFNPSPSPSGASSPRSETIIGDGVVFKGELSFKGTLIVEGTFEGNIISKGDLMVRKGGNVLGEIRVARVRVEGTIRGNIAASERLELSSTADVVGDVSSPRFAVADGAVLRGQCQTGAAATEGAPKGE